MQNDEARLLKETLDLVNMLASAKLVAGEALKQVAKLRRHHRAQLGEWQKARGMAEPSDDLDFPASKLAEDMLGNDDTPDTAAEKHAEVAEVLARAEANRSGRGIRMPSTDTAPGETMTRRTLRATIDFTIETKRSLVADCAVLSQLLTRALSDRLITDRAHGWRSDDPDPRILINRFEVGSVVQRIET